MKSQHIDSLRDLKSAFEIEEDWVAVGHVAYLLERLCEQGEARDGRKSYAPVSLALH